ncbi:MAG: hypothetical protein QJR05_02195 [Thermoanaerobacterium sp.]|nr:hypothetical protein [Thermoanaerobacterium sp.]
MSITNDNGKTWNKVNIPKNTVQIQFVDSKNGWALVKSQLDTNLYHSKNGGLSWELPSAEINGSNGSHFLKLYEIKTHKINTVGEISEKDISIQNSMIQWGKNTISVISLDKNKIFNFTY